MTVQELIDHLQKVEDKSIKVVQYDFNWDSFLDINVPIETIIPETRKASDEFYDDVPREKVVLI